MWLSAVLVIGQIGCANLPGAPGTIGDAAKRVQKDASSSNASKDKSTEFRLIDAQAQLWFSGESQPRSGILQTEDRYTTDLKKAGGVAVVNMTAAGGAYRLEKLEGLNLTQCLGIADKVDPKKIEKQILKDKHFQCIKIYLGYVSVFASDKRYLPLYKLAEKAGIPVIFHSGSIASSRGKLKYSDPMTLDEVISDFPNVQFVIAHAGFPFTTAAVEVALKNTNVVIDLSGFVRGNLDLYSDEDIEENIERPLTELWNRFQDPKRLIFGSNWPLSPVRKYADIVKKVIPEEYWNQVFFENAQKLFQIKL